MTRSNRCKDGFTLVELLVVISIIGVLVSLLLPAVNAAREAARRVHCENNLKQQGLAFLSHESAHRFFPSGGWNWDQPPTYVGRVPATGAAQRAGWGFQILPFVEEESIWEAGPVQAIRATHSFLFCPTRRGPQTVTYGDTYSPHIAQTALSHGLCDYAAGNRSGTGLVKRFEPVTAAAVTRGLSKLLMLSEKRLNLSFLGQPQEDDNEGYTAGWNSDTVRRTSKKPQGDFRGAGDGDSLFGSSHAFGINAVLADGSVHGITYEVEREIFARLGNIKGDVN